MSYSHRLAKQITDILAMACAGAAILLIFSILLCRTPEGYQAPTGLRWGQLPWWIAYEAWQTCGSAIYLLIIALVRLALLRVQGRPLAAYARHATGWMLLLLATSALADGHSRELPGPIVGSGGSSGAVAAIWIRHTGGTILSLIVLATVLALGLHLTADGLSRLCWTGAVRICARLARLLAALVRSQANLLQVLVNTLRKCGDLLHPLPAREPAANALRVLQLFPSQAQELRPQVIPIHHHQGANPPSAKQASVATPAQVPAPTPEMHYDLPTLDLLDAVAVGAVEQNDHNLRDVATLLEKALADFGLKVKVVGIHTGPVITQYELALDTGLRVSKITSLADDLALHLKVPSVRIIAPIPGKNSVGVEVPNEKRTNVRLSEIVHAAAEKVAQMKLPLFLGKDSEGRPLVGDLADMPHLLIAGRTGTGKSICLNSIILSLLLTRRPDECRLIMIDPKQVELAEYGRLPHLMHPVVTDNKKAEAILSWAVDKMEERYELLRRARVRNIMSYNELGFAEILNRVRPENEEDQALIPQRMPYIVIVVDEVGDLMMAMKKEVEGHIIRLAQKSRAAGIHLILTTQRPTVDVITGLIKSNLPARICFQVADRSNSRVVLDEMGAEKLLGKGDMLFLQPNTSTMVRAQGTLVTDGEIHRIVSTLEVDQPSFDSELMNLQDHEEGEEDGSIIERIRKRDELYEEAIEIIIREGRGSVSLLQRALGIGYGRAARLIDFMAEDGIVGRYNGAQAREVLYSVEQWASMKNTDTNETLPESA